MIIAWVRDQDRTIIALVMDHCMVTAWVRNYYYKMTFAWILDLSSSM